MQKVRSTVRLSGTIHFVGALFALYVLGWICGCVDSIRVLFQMLDVDDSGTIEVGEYRKAVGEYGGFSKKISDRSCRSRLRHLILMVMVKFQRKCLWCYGPTRWHECAIQNMQNKI